MLKKGMKLVLILICLVLPGTMRCEAMNLDLSDAEITADEGGLQVEKDMEGDNGYFVKYSGLMPDDRITRSYIITNQYSQPYTLYLRAENPRTTPADLNLVNIIRLTLTLDGSVIYDGVLGGGIDADGKTMENEIFLGTISGDSRAKLTAEFYFPGKELTNEYKGADAEVDWVFRAYSKTAPEPTSAGSTKPATQEETRGQITTAEEITINYNEIDPPMLDSNYDRNNDPDKNPNLLTGLVKTGDASQTGILAAVILLSGGFAAVLSRWMKKRR